jgi:hypothetical protein
VNDTYALSRAQLIHTIRDRVGGPPPEGLLGRVLGFAKWALQSTTPPAQDEEPNPPKHVERASDAPSESPSPSKRPTSSLPARAPVGVFSVAPAPFEEPLPTRTMARILADQGHYKRSLAIYANLLREQPDDSELRGEADAVRSQSRARRSPM